MLGTIQTDGNVFGDDNKIYPPCMLYENTILLSASSWSRFPVNEVEGKRVSFIVNQKGVGYNFKLEEDLETLK
jgi:hypothetical protein